MDGLDADVLAVEVEPVHQGLGGPDQFVALAVAGADAELPLQIHLDVVVLRCDCEAVISGDDWSCLLIKFHVSLRLSLVSLCDYQVLTAYCSV